MSHEYEPGDEISQSARLHTRHRSDGDDDLAHGVAVFHVAECLRDLFEREAPVDHRRNAAGLEELRQGRHGPDCRPLLASAPPASAPWP